MKPGKHLDSTLLSSRIRSALLPAVRLDLLPKAAIDIYLTVLDAGGSSSTGGSSLAASTASLESCAALGLTAASAALALAGVDMWGLAVGALASVQSSPSPTRILIDPTPAEAAAASSSAASSSIVSLATMPALGSVISLDTTTTSGSGLGLDDMDGAVRALERAAAKVHLVVAEALQDEVKQRQERGLGNVGR